MSMLDSFFKKGFNAPKCKTMLKLAIPRIKLLRNRRENQLKQMRREIAKLLETGQEATARIRVEHIIREEKMMASQEIVELFAELIAARLPIIETQRNCPLDLKEAISSVCFAAPRCADLPELQQVQMLFAAKYGKEFVAAATELMPECGVNRQLIELLSIRAPDPEVKIKLLKEIAEEHKIDWDPTASENELHKPHEDLLNGPTRFVSGSQLPLPEKNHNDSTHGASEQSPTEQLDSDDDDFEKIDFPEVPKASVRTTVGTVSAPEMLPFPEVDFESTIDDDSNEETSDHELELVPHPELKNIPLEKQSDSANVSRNLDEASKQFVPFISPPSSIVYPVRESEPLHSHSLPRTRSEADVDLQDVLAAAQAAANSADQAAVAARSAASLARVRISEIVKKRSEEIAKVGSENPFYSDTCEAKMEDKSQISHVDSFGENIFAVSDFSKMESKPKISHVDSSGENMFGLEDFSSLHQDHTLLVPSQLSSLHSFDDRKVQSDSSQLRNDANHHQPHKLSSMDDDFFSYPNLFKRQDSNIQHGTHPYKKSSGPSN